MSCLGVARKRLDLVTFGNTKQRVMHAVCKAVRGTRSVRTILFSAEHKCMHASLSSIVAKGESKSYRADKKKANFEVEARLESDEYI